MCQVPRRASSCARLHKPTAEDLLDLVKRSAPAVLTGLLDGWPAVERWDHDYLRRHLGDRSVTVSVSEGFFDVPEDPVRLPCRHRFCRKCVDALRAASAAKAPACMPGSKCPLCRKKLPPSEPELQAMYLKATKQAIIANRIKGQDIASLRLRARLRREARTTFQIKFSQLDQLELQQDGDGESRAHRK